MRSKFTPIYTFFALLSVLFLLTSNSGGFFNNRAGAPGEATCNGCHSGGGAVTTSGNVALMNLPSNIEAGTTHNFNVVVTQPVITGEVNRNNNAVAGFQIVATNGSNNTAVGTFTAVAGENAQVIQAGARMTHAGAKSHSGASSVNWEVSYTAPSTTLPDNIVFYAAGNAANGNGGNGSGDYGYNTSESVPTGAALAVDFLNFTTQNTTTGIRLNWSVTNENQTAYYSIERSVNGKEFIEVATQIADTQTNQYQFIDTDLVKNQIYYYRIQEVATDGKTTSSTIETATYRTLAAEVIAYPNPATTDAAVQVKLPANFAGTVQLVNVQGQVVYTQKIATQLAELTLPTTNVAAGVYQLILQDGSEVYQQKLVIR